MKILATIIVLIILVGGGFYLSNNIKTENDSMMEKDKIASDAMEEDKMMSDEDKIMEDEKIMESDDSMMMKSKGSYEDYSSDKLSRANDGDVVLFFNASWCPTCKALRDNIESNLENIPSGVSILKVDYDNSTELKQKYGVTYQHTFVQVDAEGNMINKWSGSATLDSLVSNIK